MNKPLTMRDIVWASAFGAAYVESETGRYFGGGNSRERAKKMADDAVKEYYAILDTTED
jgi:hypothetical protein